LHTVTAHQVLPRMYGRCRNEILDVSVGVLLRTMPWVWMVRK